MIRLFLLWLPLCCAALAQGLAPSALRGVYHYQMIEATLGAPGMPSEVRSYDGSATFDGSGGIAYSTRGGSYLLDEKGFVLLSSPVQPAVTLNGRASPDAGVVIASATESSGVFSLFAAVRAPQAGAGGTPLKGAYRAVALIFPGPRTSAARSGSASFQAAGVTAQIGADGRGTLTLPLTTPLPIRAYNVMAGEDGAILIGSPRSASGFFVAVAEAAEAPSGTYWLGEMAVERGRASAAVGSLRIDGGTRGRVSQRWATAGGTFNYAGVNALAILSPGAAMLEETPVFTGARGTLLGFHSTSQNHSLLFAVRAPSFGAGTGGPFLHPLGVAGAASLSPPGAPLAPGSFVTLFGERLAARPAAASTLPLPETLDGVRVEVNGRAAGLQSVSPTQVNLLLPADLEGDTARFVVRNAAGASAAVTAPLEPASPAAFSIDGSGAGAAIVVHADYSPVGPASPARRDEVVVMFGTGFGRSQPPVSVWVAGQAAEVLYSGPSSLAGLDQVNFRVPPDAAAGNAVPVLLESRFGFSDTVEIAIAP